MKTSKKILFIVLILLTAFIINFTSYPLWTMISNYESISPVYLGGFPLYMFVAALISVGFYFYRAEFKGLNDAFAKRHYAILSLVFAGVGLLTSILCGTWVYGTFFGPAVFDAYPFFMAIIHAVIIGASIFVIVKTNKDIKENKLESTRHSSVGHVFYTMGMVDLVLFALGRLGAFLSLPIYWSTQDTIYVLPYFFQLLAPMAILVCYLLYRDVLNKNEKFGLISTSIIAGVSLLICVYMIVLRDICAANTHLANSTMYINPLSQIQNPGRLLTGPINFIIMYVVVFGLTVSNLVVMLVKKIVKK